MSIDFEAVKSSFSFTLALTKIIYCSSACATISHRFLAKNGNFQGP
jgi:hypothetical protein